MFEAVTADREINENGCIAHLNSGVLACLPLTPRRVLSLHWQARVPPSTNHIHHRPSTIGLTCGVGNVPELSG